VDFQTDTIIIPYHKNGAKLVGGEIAAGNVATFVYDGMDYRLIANDRWGVPVT
jgi:hypothetical protein